MSKATRGRAWASALWLLGCPAVWAAATLTFTADDSGTFPGTLQWDRSRGVVKVDLSALPDPQELFRAELVLDRKEPRRPWPMAPTKVYPAGRPDQALKLTGPDFVSLEALESVQAAVQARQALVLRVESVKGGIARLEVSVMEGKPRARPFPQVTNLQVTHDAGQSLLTFTEPPLEPWPAFKTGAEVRAFAERFREDHSELTFRIWRSSLKITPRTVTEAVLVGECGWFTAWNAGYHQGETDIKPPLRYRVQDGGKEVKWGTGIYAHNPSQAGPAYYAVTVAVQGEEDFTQLDAGNTTTLPVRETVGLGKPILQWKETPREWHYRHAPEGGHLNRLIYTRWESWPNASRPSFPIDYLVVTASDPRPTPAVREPESGAFRVDPAPVGLHLHCWGGSLNGGYGWWHNAHHGAVLIAANQVPYDWWTGYHEAIGTGKTWGDGQVHPFTMSRLFSFLDWATNQWRDAPELVRNDWPKLDLRRVFVAGTSMGGSGAPMYAIRHGDRVAWALGWVGVHLPEQSSQFQGSYEQVYGPRAPTITMPDGQTSPWDYFNDVWYLRRDPASQTGLIIASNGKNDGAIGWPQAVHFARALQETHRPHLFNWGLGGHGTRTLIGANFDQDVRVDQTLPAFSSCSLDQDIGSGTPRAKQAIDADRKRQEKEIRDGQRREVQVDLYDGDSAGAYNAFLRWDTHDIVDEPTAWAMTIRLVAEAPRDTCLVDLTPRRLQRLRTPPGARFSYAVTDLQTGQLLTNAQAQADPDGLLTLEQIPLVKGRNRVRIHPDKTEVGGRPIP